VLSILAIPATGSAAYLLLLTLLSGRPHVPAAPSRRLRFDVVIPAHNEEPGIAGVVESVQGVDWPRDGFRVLVVADNCTDDTAAAARRAGAEVLVRQDAALRGKGYALAHAFEASRRAEWADAVVVVDADSRVSANLLVAIASRIERGEHAVQVHYGVANVHASWRTRLMAIAMAAFHRVRSRGRERLRLSCGIRGNGWALTHQLLRQVPYASFSLTEDLEYGIALGAKGIRVAYADEADCDGEMVSREQDARSQRRRWEQGRLALLRANAWPLLKHAVRNRSAICLDLALDLLVLPLSYLVLGAVALTAASLALAPSSGWPLLALATDAALVAYVLRGWQLSGAGLRGLADLTRAPFFVAWKVVLMLGGRRAGEWVRTKREERPG
jgi:cellulose synthase/poly-beta-1,6-N-acetylglucosamine synthase-like glycosyltransferase